jgi:hypothetical protein
MPLIRGINSLCVVRGARPPALVRFPPAHCSFRGGSLPDDRRSFFALGRKFRVPGFLATSFEREVRPRLSRSGLLPVWRTLTHTITH